MYFVIIPDTTCQDSRGDFPEDVANALKQCQQYAKAVKATLKAKSDAAGPASANGSATGAAPAHPFNDSSSSTDSSGTEPDATNS